MDIENIDCQEIIKEIIKSGKHFSGDLSDYEEIKDMCKEFGNGMSIRTFAKNVLGITDVAFCKCKNCPGSKISILNNITYEFTEEDKKAIVEEIIKDGHYQGESIDYKTLHNIYVKYRKDGMPEKTFVEKLLDVSAENLYMCKTQGTKVRILKDLDKTFTDEKIKKIRKDIIEAGYLYGKLIDYNELERIYKEFGNGLSKKEFAKLILCISETNYINCKKNFQRKIKIMPFDKILTTEDKESIIKEIQNDGFYSGYSANYDEIKKIWMKYGIGFEESSFATIILNISKTMFDKCKNSGKTVKLFKGKKEKQNISREEKEKIIEQIINDGFYYGYVLNYEELTGIYKKYGNGLKEVDFAEIIGLSVNMHYRCRTGTPVQILKNIKEILTEESKKKIIKKIREKGYYPGQSIDYEELNKMYKEFGIGLNVRIFVEEILGVNYSNFNNCKYGAQKKVKIFPSGNLTEEVEKEIREKIINDGHYYGQLINFEELKEMYYKYGGDIELKKFAKKILGISSELFYLCEKEGHKVRILTNISNALTEEEKADIIEKIRNEGFVPGNFIDYEVLHSLYLKYGYRMPEMRFAEEIMGILNWNYYTCKYRKINVKIKDGIIFNKATKIKELYMKESKFYARKDIEKICDEYGITIDDFIIYICYNGFYDISPYKGALGKNNGLWIGDFRINEVFFKNNVSRILKQSEDIIKSECRDSRLNQDKEDIRQNLMLYIIQNMGELERNLGDSDEFFDILAKKSRKYCRYQLAQKFNAIIKQKSIRYTLVDNDEEGPIIYADQNSNVQEQVENRLDTPKENVFDGENKVEKYINLLQECLDNKMSSAEAVIYVSRKWGISKEEMLKVMREYMLRKGMYPKSGNNKSHSHGSRDDDR